MLRRTRASRKPLPSIIYFRRNYKSLLGVVNRHYTMVPAQVVMDKARKRARVVGLTDLVVLIINVVTLLWTALLLAPPVPDFLLSNYEYDLRWQVFWEIYESHDSHATVVYFWVMVTVQCVLTTIQIGVAVFLIRSTKSEVDPLKALRMCLFWLTVNFFIFIFYLVWRVKRRFWIMLVVGTVYRGYLMIAVYTFVDELRKRCVVVDSY